LDTPWGARWYFIDDDKNFTRPAAEDFCQSTFGGWLATVDSKDKKNFMVSSILYGYGRPVYIGLTGQPLPAALSVGKPSTERELKRVWAWDSKAPFEYTFWGKPRNEKNATDIAYQPDGYGPKEREVNATELSCVSAAGSSSPAPGWIEQNIGSWNDHPCSNPYAFVCETEP
jgi:hypothetical protein